MRSLSNELLSNCVHITINAHINAYKPQYVAVYLLNVTQNRGNRGCCETECDCKRETATNNGCSVCRQR